MTTLADLTAAPRECRLSGLTLTMRPLTFADMGQQQAWAEDRATARVARRLRALLDAGALSAEQHQSALRELREDIESGKAISRELATFDGLAYSLWLSARHANPALTHDSIRNALTVADLSAASAALDVANGLGADARPTPAAAGSASTPASATALA